MSSHHIVRDDQEPALIIANGQECSQELLGQLLEWSPFVVVLDNAMERVSQLNIKVDVLLGDFDGNFNPEIYNFAYKLYEEAAHLNYTSGKPTYVNMIVFKDTDVFNMYYKLAKFEIRKKKIKSIL